MRNSRQVKFACVGERAIACYSLKPLTTSGVLVRGLPEFDLHPSASLKIISRIRGSTITPSRGRHRSDLEIAEMTRLQSVPCFSSSSREDRMGDAAARAAPGVARKPQAAMKSGSVAPHRSRATASQHKKSRRSMRIALQHDCRAAANSAAPHFLWRIEPLDVSVPAWRGLAAARRS